MKAIWSAVTIVAAGLAGAPSVAQVGAEGEPIALRAATGLDDPALGRPLSVAEQEAVAAVKEDVRRAADVALTRNPAATEDQLVNVVSASLGFADADFGVKQVAIVQLSGELVVEPTTDRRFIGAVQRVLGAMAATAQGLNSPLGDAGVNLATLGNGIRDSGGINPGGAFVTTASDTPGGGPGDGGDDPGDGGPTPPDPGSGPGSGPGGGGDDPDDGGPTPPDPGGDPGGGPGGGGDDPDDGGPTPPDPGSGPGDDGSGGGDGDPGYTAP